MLKVIQNRNFSKMLLHLRRVSHFNHLNDIYLSPNSRNNLTRSSYYVKLPPHRSCPSHLSRGQILTFELLSSGLSLLYDGFRSDSYAIHHVGFRPINLAIFYYRTVLISKTHSRSHDPHHEPGQIFPVGSISHTLIGEGV